MNPIQRILVPTDFSTCADAAADLAAEIARRFQAEVHVVTVVDTAPLYDAYGNVAFRDERIADIRGTATRRLDEFTRDRFAGLPVHSDVRDGNTVDEILNAVRETRSELVVMGTHGRTGLAHLLIGSVAEKVVRHSPVAVTTVRPAPAR
ncbi:MAG: universal stress protein [Candidatus Binatia bacterium]